MIVLSWSKATRDLHHGRARPSIRSGRARALGLMGVSDGEQSGARIGMEGTRIETGLSG
jgi:hypothetical protein